MPEEESLAMVVNYTVKNGIFKIEGNLNLAGQISLLETFLHGQVGAGEDSSKAVEKESYRIVLKWYPQNDDINCTYDTGNKGLRDGILADVLSRLQR